MMVMKYVTVLKFFFFYSFLFAIFSLLFLTSVGSYAQKIPADKEEFFSVSGLPVPRFVSLGDELTNVRAGPGQQYPVRWVYKKKGFPVEVILEYGHWRKVRDYEGSEGWVYKTLLSGDRTALVMGKELVPAYKRNPQVNSFPFAPSMRLEPMSLVHIKTCKEAFCYIEVFDFYGWIERKSLWGVYESEKFD